MDQILKPRQIENDLNRLGKTAWYPAWGVTNVPMDRQALYGKSKNGKGIIDRLQAATIGDNLNARIEALQKGKKRQETGIVKKLETALQP